MSEAEEIAARAREAFEVGLIGSHDRDCVLTDIENGKLVAARYYTPTRQQIEAHRQKNESSTMLGVVTPLDKT